MAILSISFRLTVLAELFRYLTFLFRQQMNINDYPQSGDKDAFSVRCTSFRIIIKGNMKRPALGFAVCYRRGATSHRPVLLRRYPTVADGRKKAARLQ